MGKLDMPSEIHIQLADLAVATLDPDSPIPLYHQIEEDLRQLINDGKLPVNAVLPPELVLSQAYSVGRHTMRMALSRLAADGLISRRAGHGTTVNPQPNRAKFYLDRSFTQQMADMGRQARTKVLEIQLGTISDSSPEVFANKVGLECLRLDRLRFGDDEPIGIQHAILLTERCPGLEKQDFARFGLYDILAHVYKLSISRIQHIICATIADESQAELLEIEVGAPLLEVDTEAFLDNQYCFECTTSFYRADRYEYSTTHSAK
jgi:GntR family transcriptional regulator